MLTLPRHLAKGAVLTEVPADDEPTSLKFAGSTVVVIAESKEEIITMMKNDIYGKTGVWDIDNVSSEQRQLGKASTNRSVGLGSDVAVQVCIQESIMG